MKRRYRIKNKKRFASLIVILVMFTVFIGMIVNAGASSGVKKEHEIVKVKAGQSLWEIASVNSNNKDIREYIYEIKAMNRLDSNVIHAGQILLLP